MTRTPRSEEEKKADLLLGERLADLRKEQGFTQTELAEMFGTTQAVISAYETGRIRTHGDVLVKIADALDISGDDILGLTPKKNRPINRRFLRRLEAIEKLSKQDQDALIRTIDAFLAKYE